MRQDTPPSNRGGSTIIEQDTSIDEIPGIGRPMVRALSDAGYSSLADVNGIEYDELRAMHGVGPRGLERLQAALVARGGSLAGDVPAPQDRSPVVTRTAQKNNPRNASAGQTAGATKKSSSSSKVKTHATAVAPEDYLATLETRRQAEGERLLELFGAATGKQAVMWGPSMIGYGDYHYRYASGHEGDTFEIGFSPRKAKISLYGLLDRPRTEELLAKLGPHSVGKACLYVTRLDKINEDVLAELIEHAWKHSQN